MDPATMLTRKRAQLVAKLATNPRHPRAADWARTLRALDATPAPTPREPRDGDVIITVPTAVLAVKGQ